jgi:hypothetical protein
LSSSPSEVFGLTPRPRQFLSSGKQLPLLLPDWTREQAGSSDVLPGLWSQLFLEVTAENEVTANSTFVLPQYGCSGSA